ncbi:hypothetical protein IFR04_004814 [Cadophora malorum]|uniref:Uncharacterized protein n=1 Tax=Cadophora malorum TaxID=108018 RepID=A0A8H7WC43_9HELO|nr:hypothetical protein IFR04_004814 [Cadophora malorum]|tara:strand:- start:307 stop:699 length:393 start_codon:yes stop_codon:yes gene_type:complete
MAPHPQTPIADTRTHILFALGVFLMLFSCIITSYTLWFNSTPAIRLFFTFSLSFFMLRTVRTAYSLGREDCKDEMRDEMMWERSAYIRMMDRQIEMERLQLRVERDAERQAEEERREADMVYEQVWVVDG